jgi:hypothetical protein
MHGPKQLKDIDKRERIRAVYQHACLRYVTRENFTNSSLRARFGIAPKNSAAVSRIIGEALDAGLIVPFDPETGRRYMRYVPFWVNPVSRRSV